MVLGETRVALGGAGEIQGDGAWGRGYVELLDDFVGDASLHPLGVWQWDGMRWLGDGGQDDVLIRC